MAVAVLAGGVLVVAMGLISTAVETALIRLADAGEPAAVLVLFELQALIPVVFAITVFTGATATAVLRTGLVPRWIGLTGLGVAVVFLIGAVLSIVLSADGESSPLGPAVFMTWMVVLCGGLLRASGPSAKP